LLPAVAVMIGNSPYTVNWVLPFTYTLPLATTGISKWTTEPNASRLFAAVVLL